eukprot:459024-Pelagomonas_calceolata.AAC.1
MMAQRVPGSVRRTPHFIELAFYTHFIAFLISYRRIEQLCYPVINGQLLLVSSHVCHKHFSGYRSKRPSVETSDSCNAFPVLPGHCTQCGGFFPWISWKMFLTSTAAPGNGGEG